jgi:sugar phosphate isomerase/epimerase
MTLTRRRLLERAGWLAASMPLLTAPALAAVRKPPRFGIQTYSFRDLLTQPGDMVDKMIASCRTLGVPMVELFEPTIQPPELSANAPWAVHAGAPTQASLFGRPPEGPPPAEVLANRQRIREWRLATSMAQLHAIGDRFRKAGITVQAFNFGLKEDCTDAEVEWGFEATRALGTGLMTASTTLKMAERTIPYARKHRIMLGLHGHSNLHDPNQFATPDSFAKGLAMSPWYRLNLDIGHFAAGGFDTLPFLKEHHEKIVSIHLKDRKAHDGMNMPFGQGDTPIAGAVSMIARNGWEIPMMIEYEYAGGPSADALRACLRYVRAFA